MKINSKESLVIVLIYVFVFMRSNYAQDTLVPAIITFGDSVVDVGNNDYLTTIFKANYPPIGRDFANHQPTGRFCNGKLATDITAETLGFKSFAPAYLSPQASGKNLLIGANFASAASGYDEKTAILNDLYGLGGRKIGVASLPPLGCLPATRTLFGFHDNGCVSRIKNDAQRFNKKLNSAATNLQKQLPGLKIVVFDIFKPLYDLVHPPSKYGTQYFH
ncbi:hypothetical protein TanjilG_32027 [Lupinus angustifolius]|uniref:GDSL esterase/lipase n=1 Tax=Lupinus angustifolius TaxID=3871 RepID=A0A394DHM5_LUPAN|nr:hypothetical protein TanjilG_32027 [Lupinus angustifolius]